ncbi:class I SAM-dependent methyltransferase [Streptomyces uncialis]|uniref:class I SAM-dependent methyltransferase n=1 Tax=Streptomyces uncialis TaxID=1048205 RepID=UPI003869BA47|nr:methyltransferase domain-containing protein [Streptomyces uncialis]
MQQGACEAGEGDTVPEVFERAAPDYDRGGVEFFTPLGRRLVESARLGRGQHVLDVGCGRGACTVPAAETVGDEGRVSAIDASPAMVRATSALVAELSLGQVSVEEGDAMSPAFPVGSFDAVVAGLVVFMLPDPAIALRNYATLLRPGGRLAMSSFGPVDPRFFHVTDVLLAYLPDGPPDIPGQGESPFGSKDSLIRLVESAGFSEVSVDEVGFDLSFSEPGQWWQWLWQTGGRVVLEAIPPDRLNAAREAAYQRMEEVRDEEGRLTVRWNVWFTHAVSRKG